MTQRSPRVRARVKARRRKAQHGVTFRKFLQSAAWEPRRTTFQLTSPTAPGSAIYVIHSGTFTQSFDPSSTRDTTGLPLYRIGL